MRVPKLVVAAFIAVNLLLLAACVFALRQNLALRADVAGDEALLTPPRGTTLPPLQGRDDMGSWQVIVYGRDPRPTLVYTFSAGCGFCKENWHAMRPLQTLAPGRLRIVYIDADPDLFTPEYLASTGIGRSMLLVHLSRLSEFAYDARAVPQLILVGRDGKVEWAHLGELVPGDLAELGSLIGHD